MKLECEVSISRTMHRAGTLIKTKKCITNRCSGFLLAMLVKTTELGRYAKKLGA